MAPSKLRAEILKESVSSIIWDSGTSLSNTNNMADFHGTLKPWPYTHLKVKGIAQAIKVHGQGTVLWSVLDEAGMLRPLKVPALYIQDAKVKLLSINRVGGVYHEETMPFHPQGVSMTGVPGDPNRRRINITRNPSKILPSSYTYENGGTYQVSHNLANSVSTIHHSNLNLSPAQKELLQWHHRLGHMGFKKIQFLMNTGVLC